MFGTGYIVSAAGLRVESDIVNGNAVKSLMVFAVPPDPMEASLVLFHPTSA